MKRGVGIRRRVVASAVLPKQWQDFLRVDDNKRELFAFLSKFVAHNLHDSSKQLIVSYGSDVLSVPKIGENRLMPCSQEEADTRMLIASSC